MRWLMGLGQGLASSLYTCIIPYNKKPTALLSSMSFEKDKNSQVSITLIFYNYQLCLVFSYCITNGVGNNAGLFSFNFFSKVCIHMFMNKLYIQMLQMQPPQNLKLLSISIVCNIKGIIFYFDPGLFPISVCCNLPI